MAYRLVALLLILLLWYPLPAYAYLDAGGGSVIVQAIMATGLAILVFFRHARSIVGHWFTRKKDKLPKS
jgi:hypothetical protein